MHTFLWFPGGGIFGLLIPFFLIFIGMRILRRIFFSASNHVEDRYRGSARHRLPLDGYPPPTRDLMGLSSSVESRIFRLADKMKGRLTVSDIVIGTDLSLAEAERVADGMVDGVHVSMEVRENGSVVYEFPEIIARYENGDDLGK